MERERLARSLRAFTAITSRAVRSWGQIPWLGDLLTAKVGARLTRVAHSDSSEIGWEHRALSLIGRAI